MILFLQAVARLVTLVLLGVLALAGLAVAVFSVPPEDSGLAQLADLLGLHVARDEVGSFLSLLEGDARAAEVAGCFGAVVAGLVLIAGVVPRPRERAVALPAADGEERPGRLAAARRPLVQMASALAGHARDVESLSLRVRPRRRGPGGSMRVRARVRHGDDSGDAAERIRRELQPLAKAFDLRARVSAKPPRAPASS